MQNRGAEYGLSDLELKIICDQIRRRAECRKEFLKARTDPCQHSKEAGYVFDPAIQKFISMKDTQLEYFQVNFKTIRFAFLVIVLPMLALGTAMYTQRTQREWDIRCGKTRYRDRFFKFA